MKTFWLSILLLMAPTVAKANQITPAFTNGSMNATTTTEQVVTETISQKVYGGEYKSWSGHNVTPSGNITGSDTSFTITDDGSDFQLETVTRLADSETGLVLLETIDIEREIETTATTISLSVFSQ
tara:strand:- start:1860 stop:2237 length:378 start_codon:yes stop_codon:yes gene_type:complete